MPQRAGVFKRSLKLLVVSLTVAFTLISFRISIRPPIAGRAGAYSISSSPDLPRWGLEMVEAKDAWKISQGSSEVVVAVIDSGIDTTIPTLENNMWTNDDEIPGDGRDNDNNGYVDDVSGWNFRDEKQLSKTENDRFYHGTFVAGLLASNYDNKTGLGGVAPNISIMDLRFLDDKGVFYPSGWSKLAEAIDYAVDNDADVINMSIYASVEPPDSVRDSLEYAESEGVLVVGIAGNMERSLDAFGRWDEVFTVGSVQSSGIVSDFSNYGSGVELVAPGMEVLSYRPGGAPASGTGTSFAAPHVAGTAALILSERPEIGLSDLKQVLRKSGRDIGLPGKDVSAGYGVVNTHKALDLLD